MDPESSQTSLTANDTITTLIVSLLVRLTTNIILQTSKLWLDLVKSLDMLIVLYFVLRFTIGTDLLEKLMQVRIEGLDELYDSMRETLPEWFMDIGEMNLLEERLERFRHWAEVRQERWGRRGRAGWNAMRI